MNFYCCFHFTQKRKKQKIVNCENCDVQKDIYVEETWQIGFVC